MSRRRGRTQKNKARRHRSRRNQDFVAHPRRMGHETMLRVTRPMQDAVDAIVTRLRRSASEPPRLLRDEDFGIPEVDAVLLGRYQFVRQAYGWSHESAVAELHQLCTHIQCAVNFELGQRKVFWVDSSLAESLSHTVLDISGDVLRLPFPACAFLFDDSNTLELAQRLVAAGRGEESCTQQFRMVTVYAFPLPEDLDEEGLRLVFLFDAFDREWPYLISRDIPTDQTRNIDEILSSHPDDSVDPFFRLPELQRLVHLAINAVLYTTCSDFRYEVRQPPKGTRAAQNRGLSGETVFFLPGRIPIRGGHSAEERQEQTEPSGRKVGKRFWVRGHWRRPNPIWKDQRMRWIEPYLKGPEMTVIIEREYELRTSESDLKLWSPTS